MESPAEDTNIAPTHIDVRERFGLFAVTVCAGLGAVAIAAGIILGLALQND